MPPRQLAASAHNAIRERAKELDGVIAAELGPKHATLHIRYNASFDSRVRKGIQRCEAYALKMNISPKEYVWRACKAIHAQGNQHFNVFTLFTTGTNYLVAHSKAPEDLYNGSANEERVVRYAKKSVQTEFDEVLASIAHVRTIYELHAVNALVTPNVLDVLLAVRREVHPFLLYDYLPFQQVWRACRKVLDVPHDYGTVARKQRVFVADYGVRLYNTDEGRWWACTACDHNSMLRNAVRERRAV